MSIVEILLNHDNICGETKVAIGKREFGMVHLLVDLGANALTTNENGSTTHLYACHVGVDLEIARWLLWPLL